MVPVSVAIGFADEPDGSVLVAAGGLTYVVALFAMGFRVRELRGV